MRKQKKNNSQNNSLENIYKPENTLDFRSIPNPRDLFDGKKVVKYHS